MYRTVFIKNVWNDLIASIFNNYIDPFAEQYDNAVILFGLNADPEYYNILEDCYQKYEKVIVYNAEPISEYSEENLIRMLEKLSRAQEIWDYDITNTQILKKYNFNVKHRPPLYCENLKKLENQIEPDIDLLFIGRITDHRSSMIKSWIDEPVFSNSQLEEFGWNDLVIHSSNTKFVWLSNIQDSKLINEFIARSKVILDMNRERTGIQTPNIVRMFYPLINNKCVLTPKNKCNIFKDMVVEYDSQEELSILITDLCVRNRWKESTNYDFKLFSDQFKITEGLL